MATYDCVIIGGGPGGLSSALYLKRYWRSVVIIDGESSRVAPVPNIRNLAGYDKGVSGADLLKKLNHQVKELEIPIIKGHGELFKKSDGFAVRINGESSILARRAIIATGMKDNQPNVDNYLELCKKGVLAYCPVCDAYDHTDEKIAVLVDSPLCLAKIRFIAHFSSALEVVMLKPFTWPSEAQQFFRSRKIPVHSGTLKSLSSPLLQKRIHIQLEGQELLDFKFAYVELGTTVPNGAFRHLKNLSLNASGFIHTNARQQTSVPGLYAIGDCVDALSQVSVAMGHAAIAATCIHNSLLAEPESQDIEQNQNLSKRKTAPEEMSAQS